MDSIWHISEWDLTLRLLLAVICGGLIGIERELNNHAAGFRTHILVCIGSAAIMLLSIYGFSQFVEEPNVRMDPARLAAQVISGIGFLGAGAILRNGSTVSGLTTAASIWVVAAIGLCIGAGFYYCAGLATVLVLVSLFILNKWEKHLMRGRRHREVTLRIVDKPGSLGRIVNQFGQEGIQIVSVNMLPEEKSLDGDDTAKIKLRLQVKYSSEEQMIRALEEISMTEDVISMEWAASRTASSGASASG